MRPRDDHTTASVPSCTTRSPSVPSESSRAPSSLSPATDFTSQASGAPPCHVLIVEAPHLASDLVETVLDREVARVEPVHLRVREVAQVCLTAFGREEDVVLMASRSRKASKGLSVSGVRCFQRAPRKPSQVAVKPTS